MITSSRWTRGTVPLALSIGLLIVPQAGAHGAVMAVATEAAMVAAMPFKPHFSMRQPANNMPARMPRAAAHSASNNRSVSNNSGATHPHGSTSSAMP